MQNLDYLISQWIYTDIFWDDILSGRMFSSRPKVFEHRADESVWVIKFIKSTRNREWQCKANYNDSLTTRNSSTSCLLLDRVNKCSNYPKSSFFWGSLSLVKGLIIILMIPRSQNVAITSTLLRRAWRFQQIVTSIMIDRITLHSWISGQASLVWGALRRWTNLPGADSNSTQTDAVESGKSPDLPCQSRSNFSQQHMSESINYDHTTLLLSIEEKNKSACVLVSMFANN